LETDKNYNSAESEDIYPKRSSMEGPKIQRLYYSTSDVCKTVQIRPHVLRTWEMKFSQLKPSKSKTGRRLFRPKDLDVVLRIKKFIDEDYSEEDIFSLLKHKAEKGVVKKEVSTAGETVQESDLISGIYTELKEILNILDEG